MPDTTAWIIMAAFYAPFPYLGPLLVAFLTGAETPPQRRRLATAVAIECTASMAVAFALAVLVAPHDLTSALLVLLAAMFTPYAHLALRRWRQGISWRATD